MRRLWGSWLLVTLLLLPALGAVWLIPGFVTQDGPCHLYNAWILARSRDRGSPYAGYYEIRRQPLPNWAGHLATAGLLGVTSPWIADRILTTTTALGLAAALVWLRWKVRGASGMVPAALLSALVALNFLWLMGFTSFLLGCLLFPITLGVWWAGRERLGAARLVAIAGLLVLGYFAHLVSLGLTVLALGLLAFLAPAPAADGGLQELRFRGRRLARTALCGLPMLVLAPAYLQLSRAGGPMRPGWENLDDALSVSAWITRLGWVDPLSLCRKTVLPFSERTWAPFAAFAPVMWVLLAGLILAVGGIFGLARRWIGKAPPGGHSGGERPASGRFAWSVLGLLLLIGGFFGPDSLGPGHGEYLPQRLTLLGLAALVPALNLNPRAWSGRLATAALATALGLQSLVVWDYALHGERTAGQVLRAGDLVGRNQRVATLLIRIRSRFRANPLLHADCWLGVGTGNILWSNYEARHYYFPVQFRDGLGRPDPRTLERIANSTDPNPGAEAILIWDELLVKHGRAIDRVLVWGEDPRLEAITSAWGERIARRGEVSVYARRDLRQ